MAEKTEPVTNRKQLVDTDAVEHKNSEPKPNQSENHKQEEENRDIQPAAFNRNFDGTSNSNEVSEKSSDIGKLESNISPSKSTTAHADIKTNRGCQSFQESFSNPQANLDRDWRQIRENPKSSALIDANHDFQNTPGSVSINYESKQMCEEEEFHFGDSTTPIEDTSNCQPAYDGPSQMHIGSVPRVCDLNRPTSRDVPESKNSFEGKILFQIAFKSDLCVEFPFKFLHVDN